MNRIHIIGRKNHGKTQLVVELVEEFSLRGLRVGTIKHTHHDHELDTPGKDSHRHRSAGAAVVVIDSAASLVPRAEVETDMGDRHAGLQAGLMSQALRKLAGPVQANDTVLIFTNQLRVKAGFLSDQAEIPTGGMASASTPRFGSVSVEFG